MKHVIFILLLFICNIGQTQVVVNEYSASNLHNFKDNYEKTEDWIELYNTNDTPIDISGWYLSDKLTKPSKWKIPDSTIIEGKGFILFWCSGRDEFKEGHYHTNFKLSQTTGKDAILLSDDQSAIIESHEMQLTLVEHSRCRTQDGGLDWVICTNPSPSMTNNGTNQYVAYTIAPTMDQVAGFYTDSITINIINNEPNSILRFTINGHNPTNQSPIYNDSIKINSTMVVKAQSFSNDETILPGKMDFNTYFINEDFTLDVFSVAADEVINLANGSGSLIPIGSLEYFNKDKEREAISYGSLNRHGQDSWVLPHRSLDWVSRDEMGYSKAVNAPLFSYSKRKSYQKFMFRNSGDDNYPADNDVVHDGSTHIRDEYVQTLAQEGGMKLDQRAVERVILFLNGEYWGLYGMRERPVDHDYTDEYYDQGKYDLHYLTTWGTTQAQYGGHDAFQDWYQLRDFILKKDMGISDNYEQVKTQYQVQSLIDYMLVNLNCVASDWLNYNTGWWRGLDPDGDHKKWGYILWDLDATFDYYINYSGVPNISPNAEPCDINEISEYMNSFFHEEEIDTIINPENCISIIDGSCPYPITDSIFLLVIEQDEYCCLNSWDEDCQIQYDNFQMGIADTCATILNGSCPYSMDDEIFLTIINQIPDCCSEDWANNCQGYYNYLYNLQANGKVSGNVGKHEKIFLKLQKENLEFRQLYYSRQADLMNTIYSCENMISTLDRMIAVIEPEMPRQIQRWGGSMAEWEQNVDKLKTFIEERCGLFDDGMVNCYDLTGPFALTLTVQPEGIAEIKLNTIDVPEFPWTGDYFGGMENIIKTKILNDYKNDYIFSHWESKSGNMISDVFDKKTTIELTQPDTIIAVYKSLTGIVDINSDVLFDVFPNPAKSKINIKYRVPASSNIQIDIFDAIGTHIPILAEQNNTSNGIETIITVDIESKNLVSGIYIIRLKVNGSIQTRKIAIAN